MILAIDTATPHGGVALVSGEKVLSRALLPAGRQASGTILSAVEGLFRSAGSSLSEVSHVAVSAGPGSFTGLRVGMAVAKGFCQGLGARIVPVPTLHGLAQAYPYPGGMVCPVLDARKKEVYAALFGWEDGLCRRLLPDVAVAPEALADLVGGGGTLFCGDGAFTFREFMRERLGNRAVFPPEGEGRPDAGAVGLLAARLIREGTAADLRTLVPAYLRSSEAEVRRRG